MDRFGGRRRSFAWPSVALVAIDHFSSRVRPFQQQRLTIHKGKRGGWAKGSVDAVYIKQELENNRRKHEENKTQKKQYRPRPFIPTCQQPVGFSKHANEKNINKCSTCLPKYTCKERLVLAISSSHAPLAQVASNVQCASVRGKKTSEEICI